MATKLTTDWHVAVRRTGGTTPQSQVALREYLRAQLQEQLDDNDHLICGDLFNDFTVDTLELMETYRIFSEWLSKFGRKLALLRGNHDFHMRGGQASSFDLLGTILREQYPEQVTVAAEVTEWKQFILVPHLANNDILNIEVSKLESVEGRVIVFHANIDNFHAADSQHSLNLSNEQVATLVGNGNLVVCGHEHQHRKLENGRCVVLGNTAPSSVADCLGTNNKYAMVVTGTNYELISVWSAAGSYAEVHWRDLADDYDDEPQFIRVVGDATAAESADVISNISKFRQRSNAYVITNAVKVDGAAALDEMSGDAVENIKAFDVLGAIFEHLDGREVETVKELLA